MPEVVWVTFDCYGTLIDWENGVVDALLPFLPSPVDRPAIAARYIQVEAEIERERYRAYHEVLALSSTRLLAELSRPFPPGREQTLPDSLSSWRPFPEVPEALATLRARGYRVAILSNVDRDLLAASVKHLGVTPDLMVTAEDCRSYKPAPGHWEHFRTLSGTGPERTVHVGASLYHDMAPAGTLGHRTVFINRHDEPVVGVSPTRVLPDLRGLPQVIEELARV